MSDNNSDSSTGTGEHGRTGGCTNSEGRTSEGEHDDAHYRW